MRYFFVLAIFVLVFVNKNRTELSSPFNDH